LAITNIEIGNIGYLNLRFFDGEDRKWFDNVGLPPTQHPYVVPIIYQHQNRNHLKVTVYCQLFNQRYQLNAYDINFLTFQHFDQDFMVLINQQMLEEYPKILQP